MPRPNYSINHSAIYSAAGDEPLEATCAVLKTDDGYVPATLVNRTAYARRADGVTLDTVDPGASFRIAHNGMLDGTESGLGVGSESWVRVDDDGFLERVADADIADGDDLVGRCTTDGDLHLQCNTWTADTATASGSSAVADDIAKSAGTTIDRVQGLRGKSLTSTTPKKGEHYIDAGTDIKLADRVHHVALFGAVADANETYGTPNGTDCADAIEAAIEALDTSSDKVIGGHVYFEPTEPGKAYRISRTINIRRNVTLKGRGGNPFGVGTLIIADPGVTPFRVYGSDDLTTSPSGAPGVVIEGIVIRAFDIDDTTTTGTYDAGSTVFGVSGVADTGDFSVGQMVSVDGMGQPCTLQYVTAAVTSGSPTVTLTDTGDQVWTAMGDAGGGDGVVSGTVTAGWYITIPSAYPTPTRIVSVDVTGKILTMASNAAATVTAGVVRYRANLVGMVTAKTATSLTLDAYGTTLDEASANINQTVTIRHFDCGIDIRNQTTIRDTCVGGAQKFHGFPGAAFALRGDHSFSPASTGVNLSRIENCTSYHNRHALWVMGADSNACKIDQLKSHRDWDWSIVECSTLGNLYLATHADGGWGIVTHDPPGSASVFIYPYTEGGTVNSFNDGCYSVGDGALYAGGTRIARGQMNKLQVGDADVTGAEMHMGQDDQFWRAAYDADSLSFANKDVATTTNVGGYFRFSHVTSWRNHPVMFAAATGQSVFKAGSMWCPDGLMVGDDMAFGLLDTDEAMRINAVRADTGKSGGPLHRDPKSGYFDSGTVTDSNYATWRKGDLCIDGRITDGSPIRVVTVGGHGALTWAASVNYSQGNVVRPTLANWNGSYYTKTTAGTADSGATEPTWSSAPNLSDTVVDGEGVTWTNTGTAAVEQPIQLGGFYFHTMTADADESWAQTSPQFLCGTVKITKTLAAGRTITLPKGRYTRFFWNNTGQTLTFSTGTGGTVAIAAGKGAEVGCDNSQMYRRTADVTP